MAIKRYGGLLLVLLLSASVAFGCQFSDENELPEIVTSIQSIQTVSEENNTTGIAENSESPIDEAVHDAGLMMYDMVDLLSSNGYETVAEETAGKLCDANDGFTADQRRVINDALQDFAEQAKYLIVFKHSGNDDETEWQIDFNLQVLLPADNAPESISQATHIVAVDNIWEYAMDYDNSKTKGYAAISSIRIYEFASGRLLDDLGIVKTEPPPIISYTGEAPEVHYALPGRQKIFSVFADHAGIK